MIRKMKVLIAKADHRNRMARRRGKQDTWVANFREPKQLAADRAKYCAWLRTHNTRNGVGSSKRRSSTSALDDESNPAAVRA